MATKILDAAQIAALDSDQFEALKNALIEAEQLQSAKALINALTEMINEGEFNLSKYLDMLRNEVVQFAPPTRKRNGSGARNTTGNLLLSEQTTYKPFASIDQAKPGTVPGDVLHIIQYWAAHGITFDGIVTELRNMPQHSDKSEYNVRQSARESIWKLKNFLSFDTTGATYRLTTN